MLIDPALMSIRRGGNPEYLNIDYDDKQIGHLRINADGRITGSWATNYSDRPLIDLAARCYLASTRLH
ncbi:hypothetical protein GCM10027601_20970 [Nocardioides ungokensis]|uniref:hypothetical protein n=1 Tax=Nocardioides ungokensis TaxID=1643322 RepID=UPI0015DDF2FD|nr:hypothetical protein [Nocardioides ungokensis]